MKLLRHGPPGQEKYALVDAGGKARDASAHLPDGVLALFDRYPDYSMRVFRTHRTAALPQAVYDVLDVDSSIASRRSYGGTAPDCVRAAIAAARERYLR